MNRMVTMPEVRGRLEAGRPLAPLTWLRVGGPAEWLFQPADREDLSVLMAGCRDLPVTPLGVCSNLLIRDGGLEGVAVRLGRGFNEIEILDDHRVRAGAAALDSHVARRASEAGIAGLEFLRTIPGAVGGSVRMNAGCYGSYMSDVVESITAISRSGDPVTIPHRDIGFGYRSSALPDEMVVVEAILKGRPGKPEESADLMSRFIARREASQPVRDRTAGSTFRNPAGFSSTGAEDDPMDLKAWRLIDEAGCRGLRYGGAEMSQKHPNFLVNRGHATAHDLETLGEEVRARVKRQTGHELTWEIKVIGVKVDDR